MLILGKVSPVQEEEKKRMSYDWLLSPIFTPTHSQNTHTDANKTEAANPVQIMAVKK